MTTLPNPYVGPRTFEVTERDRFFGRERETRELLALTVSEQLVLFYAQSGAGKSSLVNACLIPDLERKGFQVLPVGRVGGDAPPDLEIDNIYIFNLIRKVASSEASSKSLATMSLCDFLLEGKYDLPGEGNESPNRIALIIDQFEELFSTHPEHWTKRQDFFNQLAQAMQELPNLWVVLVMREDYIASLEPYEHLLPGRLRMRYYMQRLGRDAALKAIKQPAEKSRPYAPGVAEKLVEDLSSIRIQRQDGTLDIQTGQYVEPVQLQVVCYNLWEDITSPEGTPITMQDLESVGDVDQSLEEHYARRVKEVAANQQVSERAIRQWFGQKLITAGVRNIVLKDSHDQQGSLPDGVIEALQSDLVRIETRGRSIFYELTHDRLVEPILANNKKWEEERASVLQRQAALWDQQARSEGLLLRGQDLANAEKEPTAELTQLERDFLSACRALKLHEEHERRRNRRTAIFAFAATIAMILAVFLGWLSWDARNEAIRQKQLADSNAATAQASQQEALMARDNAKKIAETSLSFKLVRLSKANLVNNYDLAILLGLEAYRIRKDEPTVRENLLSNSSSRNLLSVRFHKERIKAVDISPNGSLLASGGWDDTIILWDISNPGNPNQIGNPLSNHDDNIESLAFSPDGHLLASGSYKEIILWDVTDPQSPTPIGEPITGPAGWVMSIAFTPDGETMVSGDWGNSIILWDISDPSRPSQIGQPITVHTDHVRIVAISPDGTKLASGSSDESAIIWDITDLANPIQITQLKALNSVNNLVFSQDGSILFSTDWRTIIVWDISNPTASELHSLTDHDDWINDMKLNADGSKLVSVSDDGLIILWDLSNPREPKKFGGPLSGHSSEVSTVSFDPTGNFIATAGTDRTVRLWKVDDPRVPLQLSKPISADTGYVGEMVFAENGNILISAGDEQFKLWDISNPEAPSLLSAQSSAHSGGLEAMDFNPARNILATGSDDTTIALWDISDPRHPTQIGDDISVESKVWGLAFSPDGHWLASGGDTSKLILWDVSDPEAPIRASELSGHDEAIWTVAFSPNGTLLASGGDDNTIILWDVSKHDAPKQISTPLEGHSEWISSLDFSADGNILASGSGDNTVILWDVSNPKNPGRIGQSLFAHTDDIRSVSLSPDARLLASGSEDKTIILWDITDPLLPIQLGTPISEHTALINRVVFGGPDGNILATGDRSATIRLWKVDFQSLYEQECIAAGRNITRDEWAKYLPDYPFPEDQKDATCPQFPVESLAHAAIPNIKRLLDGREISEALSLLQQIQETDPTALEETDAVFWNRFCWWGSLYGYAQDVKDACDKAVELDPENVWQDSRGVNRALLGDYAGALADFQIAVIHFEENGWSEYYIDSREEWIRALQAGENPFDAATIELLKEE